MANTSIAFTQDIVEGLNRKDKQMVLSGYRELGRDLLGIPLAPASHLSDGLLSGHVRVYLQKSLDYLFAYGFCTHALQYVSRYKKILREGMTELWIITSRL